jgi:hypothetical protein
MNTSSHTGATVFGVVSSTCMKGVSATMSVMSNWVVECWEFAQSSWNTPELLKSSTEHSLMDNDGIVLACEVDSLEIGCGEFVNEV